MAIGDQVGVDAVNLLTSSTLPAFQAALNAELGVATKDLQAIVAELSNVVRGAGLSIQATADSLQPDVQQLAASVDKLVAESTAWRALATKLVSRVFGL